MSLLAEKGEYLHHSRRVIIDFDAVEKLVDVVLSQDRGAKNAVRTELRRVIGTGRLVVLPLKLLDRTRQASPDIELGISALPSSTLLQ